MTPPEVVVTSSGCRVMIVPPGGELHSWLAIREDGHSVYTDVSYSRVRGYLTKFGGALQPAPKDTTRIF